MSTELLFRETPYGRSFTARVEAIDDEGGIILDRTLFYARGGGQPGDLGEIIDADGTSIPIVDTVYGDNGTIRHLPEAGCALPAIDSTVSGRLDWDARFRRMRMHTCLHLLSVVIPEPVTGGSIGDGQGRLDFDIPEPTLDKEEITEALVRLINADHPVTTEWISEEELDARPELVKTMSVKPPRGAGRIRLVRIGDIDLQPCGGTHVASTAEIGTVRVRKIEKKSRQNRRVSLILDE